MATFALDPAHSGIDFTVRHMVFSRVRGAFPKFTLDLNVDEATNMPTALAATIDAGSIDTNVADRDAHLKSPDFLDVAKYPTIDFISTRINGTPDAFTIDGDLTIHGITRRVALKASVDGRANDPWGNDRIGYSASTSINRKDFGVAYNQALETGGVVVGETLEITITIEAVNAQVAAA
jgi:polyisoprenoid-binding protein YceI